jgi:hypothetical protein
MRKIMKNLFSGNADLIAVAILALTIGIGSAIRVESAIVGEAPERMIRTRVAVFERNVLRAEREVCRVEKALRTIALEHH